MASPRDISSWVLIATTLLCFNLVVLQARANTWVTGAVFCDQCKDGQRSLFDYPLFSARVAVACGGVPGTAAMYREGETNWFGHYAVRFEGTPDMSSCSVRVSGAPKGCGVAEGSAHSLRLVFRLFGAAMYVADPLLAEPQQPMSFCRLYNGSPRTGTTPAVTAPPQPPAVIISSPPPALPLLPPPVPVFHPPPIPFIEASACPFDKWMMPEFKCYWRVVTPETKVAMAFGLLAAGKYGTDMTLWNALQGRGDPYRTLLREATTALLNSYNSIQFFYPTTTVINNMNWALLGSRQEALITALRFRRANYGVSPRSRGIVGCNFSPCP